MREIEQDAERVLADGRRGMTKMADKTDYLSREQMMLRQSKEVYSEKGSPDAHLMSGMYRRSYNPLSGKRPTRRSQSSDES